jgi:type VI secretion system protein ImpL
MQNMKESTTGYPRISWGFVALVLLFFALALLGLFLGGEYIGVSNPEQRAKYVSALASFSVFAIGLHAIAERLRLGQYLKWFAPAGRSRSAQRADTAAVAVDQWRQRELALKRDLKDRSWSRSGSKPVRLLLTGETSVVSRMLPDLVVHKWLITDHALMLWSPTTGGEQSDDAWLKHIYKMRRCRPIDAVILVLDGTDAASPQRRGTNTHSIELGRIANVLHWSAPVYVLDVDNTDAFTDGRTAILGCEFPADAEERAVELILLDLRSRIGNMSVGQLIRSYKDRYAVELSQRLDKRSAPLAAFIASLSNRKARHQSVSGAFFAPFPAALDAGAVVDPNAPTSADLPLWTHLATITRKARGKRMGMHPVTVFSTVALTVIGVWTAGMLISGMTNARNLVTAREIIHALKTAPDSAARLNALLALQQQIGVSEQRVAHQPPLWTRFGLNQDKAILAALWPSYTTASKSLLITPIQENLEATLVDLSQMPTDSLDDHANAAALEGHKALKTYLMLAEPSRIDAGFITPQLMHYWTTNANVSVGAKLDISERLSGFYAQHLKAHDAWRIQPRAELVNASRQTLLSVIGVRNSEDTVYQSVLAGVGNKYPDQTLASLTTGTDTRGLIRTTATVPGVYTRQAYEGYVAAAIKEAAKSRNVTRDWVLANSDASANAADPAQTLPTDALEAALTTQYFNDYAEHWQTFMNALQWQSAPNIPAAIEQMKLLADARQSPVIALLKSLDYQGTAGMRQASLSDTIVAKAQNIFGKKDEAVATAQANETGPLSASFGPVLRLIGQVSDTTSGKANANAAASDVSVQRYIERIIALRLKLQQISNGTDADAQTRQLAQALFQGKNSELADTQAYAQLVAASLGAQWSGMGDALFVRPVAQATQIVIQPAQASLNDVWHEDIVVHWNKSFAGRYPFDNTDNDVSIPELARFIRLQGGLISSFLSTQLAGVLELRGDQWVEVNTRSGALQFDPDFLRNVNILQRVAGHLMPEGEPQYRFDLKPIPTFGITDTMLTLDAQKLHYYNQRETWQGLKWPSTDPQTAGTRLQWQTETAGTSKSFEFGGRWALVRMLERAKIEPIDNATFQLTWQAEPDTRMSRAAAPLASVRVAASERGANRSSDDWGASAQDSASANRASLDSLVTQPPLAAASANLTYPLSYFMRVEIGKGPLELLALRGFKLPSRMFIDKPRVTPQSNGANPPPLPQAAREAAKQAATPLPGNVPGSSL